MVDNFLNVKTRLYKSKNSLNIQFKKKIQDAHATNYDQYMEEKDIKREC